MTIAITYVSHATSLGNEAGRASGLYDVALSERGREQALERRAQFAGRRFDAVVCSDLQRAVETAEIAFAGSGVPLRGDARLRELDCGALTREPRAKVDAMRPRCVDEPFPDGESYRDAVARTRSLLDELAAEFAGGHVVLVGHRATRDCLEHLANGVPLAELAAAPPGEWEPEARYEYDPARVVTA